MTPEPQQEWIELKSDPPIFYLHKMKLKTFDMREVRDRNFKTTKVIILREFDRDTQRYSGEAIKVPILWVLFGPAYGGLNAGYCIMSLDVAKTEVFKW